MGYVLGVDGGGSKTLAVVGDEAGRVRGVGRAAGSNHQGVGLDRAMLHVCVAAEAALADAGVARDDLSAAFYALAGADLPEDFDLLRPAVHALGFGTVMGLDNDTAASLRSGTDNPNAVVVGWGSGVNGMGRNVAGQGYRLPALGDISGDWGGGDDLAREAIWLVARAHDGRGRPTMLTGMVLSTLDVPTVDEMIRKLYLKQADLACFRLLPHVVFRAANAGDAVAQDLVERAATEVVTTAVALLRRLGLLEVPADVVLAGSVFRAEGTLFLESIVRRLQEAAPLARIVVPEIEPVVGAYFCALDLAGIAVGEHARALARATYEALAARAATEVRAW